MKSSEYYIGLMSGTSLDGIDVALVAFDKLVAPNSSENNVNDNQVSAPCRLVASSESPLPATMVNLLAEVSVADSFDLNRLFQAEVELAHLFAQAVGQLLEKQNIKPSAITAIGSHGITIRHFPNAPMHFSKQIGCGSTLAALTGIDVICDFRVADVAEGGQGAPLVPPFHAAMLDGLRNTAVLNLGGIANLSFLDNEAQLTGFDTGPANTLIDAWCLKHTGQPYDKDGRWAETGQVNHVLLGKLLEDSYFFAAAPKSTGKEHFNLQWLQQNIECLPREAQTISPADIQATLLQLTVKSIQLVIQSQYSLQQVLVCGGGVHNTSLMTQLSLALPQLKVASTLSQGICPDAMEAMAFAWLAYCRVHNIKSNSPSVTGASKSKTLGAWHKC